VSPEADARSWSKATVGGIENKLAATTFIARPRRAVGYGLQLILDGIRH
jgi:hypothetical protein